MLSCTNCRHAAVSRIPQKRKFCEMNLSDCRNHKFPGFHDFMLDAIRGISSFIKFKWINIKWLFKMSGPIREQRQKCHYSSSIGVESRTGTVVESKKRLTSKRNFVLDSTTFLNFRVPDSTKSSEKLACALWCSSLTWVKPFLLN